MEDKIMKFKLGQKIKYKRISKKIEIDMQYWTPDDFEEGEEKELERREFIELKKERTGLIIGRRNLVFKTIFTVKDDYYVEDDIPAHYVDIARQEKGFSYLIAYDMGHTNFVLEEDLKLL
jgi:hypothetical protein